MTDRAGSSPRAVEDRSAARGGQSVRMARERYPCRKRAASERRPKAPEKATAAAGTEAAANGPAFRLSRSFLRRLAVRATANATLPKLLGRSLAAGLLDQDPKAEPRDHQRRDSIGGEDIGCVGHRSALSAARAESRRMATTRRRQMSARIAIRCSVTK